MIQYKAAIIVKKTIKKNWDTIKKTFFTYAIQILSQSRILFGFYKSINICYFLAKLFFKKAEAGTSSGKTPKMAKFLPTYQ